MLQIGLLFKKFKKLRVNNLRTLRIKNEVFRVLFLHENKNRGRFSNLY